MKKEKSDYSIQAVESALDVLEQFLVHDTELGVTELSRRLNLNKNNIFRLLATLESRNYIEQNRHTDGYRLGIKNLELGQSVVRQMELHHQARPVLEALVRQCNETADVAILRGSHIHYLHAVESTHPVRVVPRVGIVPPAFCTAAGKVLLACAIDRDTLPSLELRQYAPNTIIDRKELVKQLKKIALKGYAVEDEELAAEVRAVAAPVRDYTGCVVGAVSVSGPEVRFGKARLDGELVPIVIRAADEISLRMGYSPIGDVARKAS
jgi:DNA-binding IclR family transcriptional regulator